MGEQEQGRKEKEKYKRMDEEISKAPLSLLAATRPDWDRGWAKGLDFLDQVKKQMR